MQSKKFIQVFEHQRLKCDDSGDFRKYHFDAMVRFNDLHQNKYFTIGHNGIVFKNYVGVIQVGGLTIEILPKADKKADADKSLWQSVLLNMLKVCKRIRVESVSETQLKKRHYSILDDLSDLYCQFASESKPLRRLSTN